jgi:anaerobic selenocysteine-containing dehydrogenase
MKGWRGKEQVGNDPPHAVAFKFRATQMVYHSRTNSFGPTLAFGSALVAPFLPMEARTIRTVCPRNCYCTCGMLVTVEGDRIIEIQGDPENAATEGTVCLKGLSYAQRYRAPDRLTSPLRRGDEGVFEPVSWEEALDEIASRLQSIREESGPEAALYYEGSGSHGSLSAMANGFWRPYGGPTRAHGDLCWPAGLEATRLTYGENRHNHPVLTRESRFILLWGHNPAETNIHQWRFILDAREKGARVAVVDPRSTDSTDLADLHLQPRPGTDGALALGLAHVIISEGLHDADFLGRSALGFEEYRERVQAYPPGRVAEITGLEEDAIVGLAREYASTQPALLMAGFGLQRHRHAGQAMRAVSLLPALTGSLGVPGGGWQYANLASFVLGAPPRMPPEPEREERSFPTSRLGWNLQNLNDPPLRAAWFEKANPVSQHPNTNEVLAGFRGLDLVVVVDQFLTDTAREAHFVLPAKNLFEEEDLVTAYWHPYVQLRQKVMDPPQGILTETEIWRRMAMRLGFDTAVFDVDPRERLRAMLPPGREEVLEELADRPLDLSDRGDVVWADGVFLTPSGKVEFLSEEAHRIWGVDPLPDYTPLPEGHEGEEAGKYPLQLLTCKTRDRIHSQFGNLSWIQEVDRPRVLDLHPDDARARGLGEGDLARIFNGRGETEVPVHLSEGIRPGVVHVIEGRCVDTDPWLNLVTNDGVTDIGYGATFYECLVEVEPA